VNGEFDRNLVEAPHEAKPDRQCNGERIKWSGLWGISHRESVQFQL
jgi:hypothetical protein